MSDLVRLTVVANELEADIDRSLLSTAGIQTIQRCTDLGADSCDGMPSGGGPREILVHEGDLETARQLVATD